MSMRELKGSWIRFETRGVRLKRGNFAVELKTYLTIKGKGQPGLSEVKAKRKEKNFLSIGSKS